MRNTSAHAVSSRPVGLRLGAVDAGAAVLACVAVLLVGLSLLTRYLAYRREAASPGIEAPEWMTLFDVNSEANVPTWFSVALLAAAGAAAVGPGLLSRSAAPGRSRFFLGLAVVLLLLSLDEMAGIHERLGALGAVVAGGSGLHFVWVVPGAAAAVLLLAGLVLGGRSLPSLIRRRLSFAAAVYLTGALVVEAVSGQVLAAHGDRAGYLVVTAVEELLEMLGVVLVLRAVCGSMHACHASGGWTLQPL
ncbi:hypothetical protein [Blastococcus sp. PRF04-17]|uniref:hypothetical protein n=1 Tax=Blastococcus sp. PRF04-17 TaxID=2933797 RepID=UPI001FF5AC5A|nr:hypothetical protein [Blastococcus sp. PRF04-17]UOY03602.1 hypothetical protein MVA48_09840 [Blastococcus sp. PRF04-17]